MTELSYRSLIWLTYRLASIFVVGLPFVIYIWSLIRKEASICRLLSIYWKVSSIMLISLLLLTNNRPLGYLLAFISPILILISIWFWTDLNEELGEFPPLRPLSLTTRIWRWCLSGYGILATVIGGISLKCFELNTINNCKVWTEAPLQMHENAAGIFKFLFGANWSEPLSAFLGYVALVIYILGILQWLFIRMPKQGRIAGDF